MHCFIVDLHQMDIGVGPSNVKIVKGLWSGREDPEGGITAHHNDVCRVFHAG
jgi:hypothetical protein